MRLGNFDLKLGNFSYKLCNFNLKLSNFSLKFGNFDLKLCNFNLKLDNFNLKSGNFKFRVDPNRNVAAENRFAFVFANSPAVMGPNKSPDLFAPITAQGTICKKPSQCSCTFLKQP